MVLYLIYGLVDPRTLLIRYVGRSSSGLRRPKQHRQLNRKEDTHCSHWIQSLAAAKLTYAIVILEETTQLNIANAERWWIAFGRACGWPLTNHTDGGEGLSNPSARTREKIRAAMQARMSAPEERERSRALARTYLHTAEAIAAATQAKGTKEYREAHSRLQKERWTPEQRAAAGEISRTRNREPEMRERIGAFSKARMSTPEAKERQSALSRARFATPEARAMHAASIKKRTRLFGEANPTKRADVRAKMSASARRRCALAHASKSP